MKFWLCASGAMFQLAGASAAQSPGRKPVRPKTPIRQNESMLAGLRVGSDTLAKAKRLYGEKLVLPTPGEQSTLQWAGLCTGSKLRVDAEESTTIQSITVTKDASQEKTKNFADCPDMKTSWGRPHVTVLRVTPRWITGQGLGLGAPCSRAVKVYGQPSSRGPSTKDGQELELLYYQFDWAGPDVPQVMEVLCTPEKNGKPGRVVEIMLEAASL